MYIYNCCYVVLCVRKRRSQSHWFRSMLWSPAQKSVVSWSLLRAATFRPGANAYSLFNVFDCDGAGLRRRAAPCVVLRCVALCCGAGVCEQDLRTRKFIGEYDSYMYVVDVSTINQFKARLDKFWMQQDVWYTQPTWPDLEIDQYMKQIHCVVLYVVM